MGQASASSVGDDRCIPAGPLQVGALACEYAPDPIGLHTLAPRFAWRVEGGIQAAWRIQVGSAPEAVAAGDAWDSGWVAGDAAAQVAYAGTPLASRAQRWWRVQVRAADGRQAVSPLARFEMGLLGEADWEGTEWVGLPGVAPGRALCFRAVARVDGAVRAARLYAAGLGVYRLYINGSAVSDRVLDPPPTCVERSVPYTVHDVTALIGPETVLAAVVGHGWYGRPIIRLRLEITLADGRRLDLASLSHQPFMVRPGGIVADGLFFGESWDGRREPVGWMRPGYDPAAEPVGERHERWFMTSRVAGPSGRLAPDLMEPVRVVETIEPACLGSPRPGAWVLDAGANLAGWCRVRGGLPAGTRLSLAFGETLAADGTVNQGNLSAARACDEYVADGGDAAWEPRTTYHGFRYVQVEGLDAAPEPGLISVRRVRNDIARRGAFACGDELAGRIHAMIVRTEESNQHGIPTDCPQRAERQGWLNDQTARAEQLVHNFHAQRFLAKWLDDLADAQDPITGAIPDTVPWHFGHRRADPVCVCPLWYPWLLWRHWGDRRVLERHWGMMAAWQGCLAAAAEDGVLDQSAWGDWCPPRDFADAGDPLHPAGTPGGLVSTAHLVFMTRLLARIAGVLGRDADAARLAAEAAATARALNRRWFDRAAAAYGGNIQACNALALWMEVVPAAERGAVFARLVEDVERRGHLTTGNICTKYVLEALADGGRADLAWRLVTRRAYPSWGFMLAHGATTVWERWEHRTGAGMNSHNHSMLGAVDAWFYTRLVGLRDDEGLPPGDGFLLAPAPVPGLAWAEARLDTLRGPLRAAWRREGDAVVVEADLPPGASARLRVPAGFAAEGPPPVLCGSARVRLAAVAAAAEPCPAVP